MGCNRIVEELGWVVCMHNKNDGIRKIDRRIKLITVGMKKSKT